MFIVCPSTKVSVLQQNEFLSDLSNDTWHIAGIKYKNEWVNKYELWYNVGIFNISGKSIKMRSFITCVVVSHHKWEVYFPQIFVFTYMAISQHFFLFLEKVLFLIIYYFNLNLFYHICKLKLTKLELAGLIFMRWENYKIWRRPNYGNYWQDIFCLIVGNLKICSAPSTSMSQPLNPIPVTNFKQ